MTVKAFCKRLYLRLAKTSNHREQQQPLVGTARYRKRVVTIGEQLLLQVKCIVLLVLVSNRLHANVPDQDITINQENVSIQTIFKEIERQSSYRFFYNESLLQGASKVTIQVQHASLEEALSACFRNQPLSYSIIEKTIIVKRREAEKVSTPAQLPVYKKLPLVKGVVEDSKGPVAGATVTVKETNEAVTTNNGGAFTLSDIEENSTLSISSVSHMPIEVSLKGQASVSIKLQEKVQELDDAVAVAYTTTTQRRATGSFTVVKGEEIQSLPNRSFEKSLQGLVPGLLVNSGNGQPGSAPNHFVLRGIATGGHPDAGQTFRNPLVIVDGVPVYQDPLKPGNSDESPMSNPMAQLNPSDIETITVLKDAAAIALYGSKASNGVILVTTKKGKAGKTTFSFRHQSDINEKLKDPELLNQQEYIELLLETYRNTYPGITDNQILSDLRTSADPNTSVIFPTIIKNPGDTSFYPTPDWSKQYYRKTALTTANEISMSGGNEWSNFYLNVEYTKQDGVVRGTGFDRKSVRFNYENRITSWFKLGLNTTSSYTIQDYETSNGSVLTISPLLPITLTNGNYIDNYSWGFGYSGGDYLPNPIVAAKLNINRNTAYRGLSRLYGELKFLQNFTLSSSIGADFILNENKQKKHPRFFVGGVINNGSIQDRTERNAIILTTNMLRFDKTLKSDHNINLLLGQEAQILSNKWSDLEKRGFGNNPTTTEPYSGIVYNAGGNKDKQTLLSYFGQVGYGFRSKYLLSGSIRTDGSSRFGNNKRFGTYWSVGGGWIVTAEPFMKRTGNWLNYLKLRGSIGAAGNSTAISGLLRYDPLRITTYLNNTAVLPNWNASPGNPDIQWEETFTWDAGMEARFFNGRITASVDFYNKKTEKLIASYIILPATTGYNTITDNIGDLKNTGIELSFAADIIRTANFRWNLNANWSKNQSKLVKAYLPQTGVGSGLVNKVDEAYNSFNLPVWAGVNSANGRPMWIDSTGKPSEDYYAAKPEIVGKVQPDGFGSVRNSFSYKGFELSAMIYYQYGFQINLNNILQSDGVYPYFNQSKTALNRWQKPGDIAANPRRLLNGATANGQYDFGAYMSTRYLLDGDFIRLSNVALAYSFPRKMAERIKLNSLKIFIQGHNLGTWTKYTGRDPENVSATHGRGNYLYPQQRSFSLGLNLSF